MYVAFLENVVTIVCVCIRSVIGLVLTPGWIKIIVVAVTILVLGMSFAFKENVFVLQMYSPNVEVNVWIFPKIP